MKDSAMVLRGILAIFFISSLAVAEESSIRTFSIPDHGSIRLRIPKSWQTSISSDTPPTIELAYPVFPALRVLLTPVWTQNRDELPGPADLKKGIEEELKRIRPQILEKDVPIIEMKGPSVFGYYFSGTDKSPNQGEFGYMSQGIFRLGDLVITFTALMNVSSKKTNTDIISILDDAVRVEGRPASPRSQQAPAASEQIQITQAGNQYLLTVPVSKLILHIPKANLSVQKNPPGGGTGNPRYFSLQDPVSNLIVSGWFEPAERFPTIKKLWQDEIDAWRKNKMPEPRDVLFKKVGNWDCIFYSMQGKGVTSSHIRAHWLQAGTWIELHLSTTSAPAGQSPGQMLEPLLKSFVITEKK